MKPKHPSSTLVLIVGAFVAAVGIAYNLPQVQANSLAAGAPDVFGFGKLLGWAGLSLPGLIMKGWEIYKAANANKPGVKSISELIGLWLDRQQGKSIVRIEAILSDGSRRGIDLDDLIGPQTTPSN